MSMPAVNEGSSTATGSTGPQLRDADFAFLRAFVYEHCGISLSEQKRQLVQGRLLRRLRSMKLNSFEAYCELLRRDPQGELGELASCISTNVTAFFRESHHFDLLSNELLPKWIAEKKTNGGRLRIWSAGCATGEEPYTLAMVLAEALEKAGGSVDAKILATDLSPQALETARRGIYAVDRLEGISTERRRRWLVSGDERGGSSASIHSRLRELVTILPLNLLHDWPMSGPFDAIFCRNVVIYFDKPTKERLFRRFAGLLPDGGRLFLGHSESMYGLSEDFDLIGRTVYQRRPR